MEETLRLIAGFLILFLVIIIDQMKGKSGNPKKKFPFSV